MTEDEKVLIGITHVELLELASYHFQVSAAYRESEGGDEAAMEHWQRAEVLASLVPEADDKPLDAEAVEAIQEAGARLWAEEHGLPWPMSKAAMRALLRGPKGQG